MSGIYRINTDQISGQVQQISGGAAEIRGIAEKILACKSQLRLQHGNAAQLKQQIAQLHNRALEAAVQMDTLKEALDSIAQMYMVCEQRIVENANGASAERSQESSEYSEEGTDKRSWWRRLVDWLFRNDTDPVYTHTTDAQEAAADARMQRQIQNLTDQDRYTEDAWREASYQERLDILGDYIREVMEIMGLDINPNIDFHSSPPNGGYITNGSYTHGTETVFINTYIIANYSAERSYELFTTVVHELRHAYQHAAVDHPTRYQVSQATIDRWSESFDNYRGTDRIMREDGVSRAEAYERYRNQAVEVDARAFAGQD